MECSRQAVPAPPPPSPVPRVKFGGGGGGERPWAARMFLIWRVCRPSPYLLTLGVFKITLFTAPSTFLTFHDIGYMNLNQNRDKSRTKTTTAVLRFYSSLNWQRMLDLYQIRENVTTREYALAPSVFYLCICTVAVLGNGGLLLLPGFCVCVLSED